MHYMRNIYSRHSIYIINDIYCRYSICIMVVHYVYIYTYSMYKNTASLCTSNQIRNQRSHIQEMRGACCQASSFVFEHVWCVAALLLSLGSQQQLIMLLCLGKLARFGTTFACHLNGCAKNKRIKLRGVRLHFLKNQKISETSKSLGTQSLAIWVLRPRCDLKIRSDLKTRSRS